MDGKSRLKCGEVNADMVQVDMSKLTSIRDEGLRQS